MDPGIIGGKGQRQIVLIEIEKIAKLSGSSPDILEGIIDIPHPEGDRRIRRQLHEPHRTFSRHGVRAKIRLNLDHRAQEGGIETIAFRVERDRSTDFLCGIARTALKIRCRGSRSCCDQRAQKD
jgi:hypothetical protein